MWLGNSKIFCTKKSDAAFGRAIEVLVGGVNSPVRSFAAVGGTPPVIASAVGSKITDIDGNTYIDYVGAYGPAILGHAAEVVVSAVAKAARKGMGYGAPTQDETRLAEAIVSAYPSIEKVRMVSSGTEAVMSAVRLARGYTGRDKIVKCAGCYHGHSDALLASAGSGAANLGIPSSAGVTATAAGDTLVVPYNDLAAMEELFSRNGREIAALLVEPIAGNMGLVPPADGYLAGLRSLCDEHGALLIFDEVMTGFRVARGGAQELYNLRADITTLGKIIGGGLPVGAFGASAQIMSHLAPEGSVYQAGTLSGNPVATAAGLATLEALRQEGFYERLETKSAELAGALAQSAISAGVGEKVCFNRVGSMMSFYFTPGPVRNYVQSQGSNAEAFTAFFHAMLKRGVYLPPSRFESIFVSDAHDSSDIAQTAAAAKEAFAEAAKFV